MAVCGSVSRRRVIRCRSHTSAGIDCFFAQELDSAFCCVQTNASRLDCCAMVNTALASNDERAATMGDCNEILEATGVVVGNSWSLVSNAAKCVRVHPLHVCSCAIRAVVPFVQWHDSWLCAGSLSLRSIEHSPFVFVRTGTQLGSKPLLTFKVLASAKYTVANWLPPTTCKLPRSLSMSLYVPSLPWKLLCAVSQLDFVTPRSFHTRRWYERCCIVALWRACMYCIALHLFVLRVTSQLVLRLSACSVDLLCCTGGIDM